MLIPARTGKFGLIYLFCFSYAPDLSAYPYFPRVSCVLAEQMDTTTPQGEFLFHVFGALAQFERSLIQERVQAGLAAARRRGRRGGRPAAVDAEKLAAVIVALDAGATKAAVCRTFAIKRSTLIDSLARVGWSAGIKV
jgi:DNA invertase Pin-like site-specific DNA recombinase